MTRTVAVDACTMDIEGGLTVTVHDSAVAEIATLHIGASSISMLDVCSDGAVVEGAVHDESRFRRVSRVDCTTKCVAVSFCSAVAEGAVHNQARKVGDSATEGNARWLVSQRCAVGERAVGKTARGR